MSKPFLLFTFVLISFVSIQSCFSQAQDQPKDSVSYGFIPALSYTSDLGFIGGAIVNRFHFDENQQPYRNRLLANVLLSTKGFYQLGAVLDEVSSFGTNIRSQYELSANRLNQNNFFGIGNNTTFEEARFDNQEYIFESVEFSVGYLGRLPIWRKGTSIKRVDILGSVEVSNFEPASAGEETVFALQPPIGSDGAFISILGTGVVWENRDNEIIPTQGNRFELRAGVSPSVLSTFSFARFSLETTHFFSFHLINKITVASRVYLQHVEGDAPFWFLSDAGRFDGLRGFPFRRFIDQGAIQANLELRTWLFDFDSVGIKVGGQLFTDAGRVFSGFDDYSNMFIDLKHTYGLGGAVSLFDPNFIIRADLGFSEEMSRLYIGFGYLF